MTQLHTRKSFFGKIVALVASAGLAPGLFAKRAVASTATPAKPFTLRPDARAVSRRSDTV